MKKHKLVKEALKHPELHTEGEMAFFNMWLKARKEKKERKRKEKRNQLERCFYQ